MDQKTNQNITNITEVIESGQCVAETTTTTTTTTTTIVMPAEPINSASSAIVRSMS